MNKKASMVIMVAGLLLAAPFLSAQTTNAPCRIVDYGDEWTRHGVGSHGGDQNQWRIGFNSMIGETRTQDFTYASADVDGDGSSSDDYVASLPFSMTQPLSVKDWPSGGVYPERINKHFYGGVSWAVAGSSPGAAPFYYEMGINPDHEGPFYNAGAEDHPLNGQPNSTVSGSYHHHYICALWKKEDFLNGGASNAVSFDGTSQMSVMFARYWFGFDDLRFVVQENGQFYISRNDFNLPVDGSYGWTTGDVFTLSPTGTQWAVYNPTNWQIGFNPSGAVFAARSFTNLNAVGFYLAKTNNGVTMSHTKWYTFAANAVVQRPAARPSEHMSMAAVPGDGSVSNFFAASQEVPYSLWRKIYRYANSPIWCLEPRYLFIKDGDMGSMQYSNLTHGAQEPAVNFTLYDAASWLNALSELEGRKPCYYTDATMTNVFRNQEIATRAWYTNSYNDKHFMNPNYSNVPAAKLYVRWASDGYRLPTPAEWDRVWTAGGSRSGTTYSWVAANSTNRTQAVAVKQTNDLGCYDLEGNAWELTWPYGDSYDPNVQKFALVKGGGFQHPNDPRQLSANPWGDTPFDGRHDIGIRPVRRAAGLAAPATGTVPSGDDYYSSASIPVWKFASTNRTATMNPPSSFSNVVATVALGSNTFLRSPENSLIRIQPMYAGKFEVSYAKWKEVYFWGVTHGYTFDGDGAQGSMALFDYDHSSDEPVTQISWHDTLVWCNALSEMENRTPVYYSDETCTNVYRSAIRVRSIKLPGPELVTDPLTFERMEDRQPWIFSKWDGNGYRLPTAAEWESLARGGTQSTYFWGTSATAATNYCWGINNAGGRTRPVGQLRTNAFGLYDIQGNVAEMLWSQVGESVLTRDYLYDVNNPKAGRYWGWEIPKTTYAPKNKLLQAGSSWLWGGFALNDTLGAIPSDDLVQEDERPADMGFRVVRCDTGVQPADGNYPLEEIVLLNYTNSNFNLLQGQTAQANLYRNGQFPGSGPVSNIAVRWKVQTGGPVKSPPVVMRITRPEGPRDVVFVGTSNNYFMALDALSGEELWRIAVPGGVQGGACVANNTVYFGGNDKTLYAVNAPTGTVVWAMVTNLALSCTPAVAYTSVFCTVGNKSLGFNATNGLPFWQARENIAWQDSAVTLMPDFLLAAQLNSNPFHKFALRTGQGENLAMSGAYSRSSAAVQGDVAYIANAGNIGGASVYSGINAFRITATNMTKLWGKYVEAHLPEVNRSAIYSSPSVWSNRVYIGTDSGYLYAFNTTNGAGVWSNACGGPVRTAPAIAVSNQVIYFGSQDGKMYAVNALSGAPVWNKSLGSAIDSTAFIYSNRLYVGCDDGAIYCLHDSVADYALVAEENNVAVPEGGTNNFRLRLSSAPAATTTVKVSRVSGDTDISLTGSTQFVFSASTWSNWQMVALSAAEDADSDHGETWFSCAATGMSTTQVRTVEVDNDLIIMLSTNAVSVREGGSTNFSMKLSSQPSGNLIVTVARISGDTDITVANGSTNVLFTSANWSTWQPVTLAAAQDLDQVEGTATIRCSASGLPNADLTATEDDDDLLELVLSSVAMTLREGTSNALNVSLSIQPTQAVVTVSVARISGDTDISVSGSTLVFDVNNWDIDQTLWISAAEDADALNGQAVIRGSSPGLDNKDVTVTERENDPLTWPAGTTVMMDNSIAVSGVKRMGMNLTGDDYYNGALMKKRQELNFEGTSYRQAHKGYLFNDAFATTQMKLTNIYTYGWDKVYVGARYEVLSGPAKGTTGTVVAVSNRVYQADGLTLTNAFFVFSNPLALTNTLPIANMGLLVENIKLNEGNLEPTGYQMSGNCTVVTNDVHSNSFGTCAMWMDGSVSQAVKRLTTQYQVFGDCNGTWNLSFKARKYNGTPAFSVDPSYGATSNLTISSTSWQNYNLSMTITNVPEMLSITNTTIHLTLALIVTNGGILIDDIELWQSGVDTNPTAFKDQAVNALKKLRPGILRRLQMGGNSVSNAIMPRIKAYTYMNSIWDDVGIYGSGPDQNPWGMHEFFQLCEEIGAEPWFNLPGTLHQDEMNIFMEYIGGPTNTPWGKVRADLGHPLPWTQAFTNIHVEIGNEAWNTFGGFQCGGFNGADYWNDLFARGKSSAYYSGNVLFHAAGQASSGSSSASILGFTTNADRFAIAPYMRHDLYTTDLTQNPATNDLFRWHFGLPYYVIYTNQMNGHVDNCAAAGVELSVYEVNHHVTGGDAGDANATTRRKLSASIGASLNMANTLLPMLKLYNVRSQAFFDFIQYNYDSDTGEDSRLWGSYINLRPGMERTRPTGLMLEMLNNVIGPEMLNTAHFGDLYTASGTGRYEGSSSNFTPITVTYPTIQSFAFRDGNRRTLVLLNLDVESNLTVSLNLNEHALNNQATTWLMTSASITDNNDYEQAVPQVAVSSNTVSGFTNGVSVSMPPFSIRTLSWLTNGALPRVVASTKQLDIPEAGTAQFQIRLDSAPAADLTVNVNWSSGDTNIYVPGGSTFTFTPANYADWQTVTLAADADDDVVNGEAIIRCQTAEGTVEDVTATETDDDFKLLVSRTALSVPENGTNSFQIRLAGPPNIAITASVARVSGDTGITITSPATLVFDTVTWSNWQNVVLADANDTDLIDGSAVIRCSLNAGNYTDITATEVDDDPVRLTLNADTYVQKNSLANFSTSTNLSALYDNNTNSTAYHRKAYIRFSTTNLPSDIQEVSLTLTASMFESATAENYEFEVYGLNNGDSGESWNPNTITWSNAPAFTEVVTNVDVTKATLLGRLSMTAEVSKVNTTYAFTETAPGAYKNFLTADTNGQVTFIVVAKIDISTSREVFFASYEHQTLPGPQLTVYYEPSNTVQVSTASPIVPEGGTTDFQLRLGAPPYGSVTVSTARVSGDTDLNVVSGDSWIFTSADWDQWQTVTLSAAPDADILNGQAVFRCVIPGIASNDVTATELDTDSVAFIASTDTVQVVEGQTNQFLFKLSAAPTSAVTVTISRYSGSTNIQAVGTTQFVFNAGNWNTWATGRVYAARDANLLHDTATVVCTSSGGTPGPLYILVTEFDTDARHITLSTNALAFTNLLGYPAPSVSFSAANTGGGTMDYSVATNASWLTVTPSSVTGLGGGTSQVHVLSVRTNGLVPGVSNATLTVTSGQADNSPQTITVTMTVNYAPIPVLSFSPTNLNFVWGNASTSTVSTTNLSVGFENMATGTNMPAGWTQVKYGAAVWKIQKGGYTGGSHPSTAHGGSNNVCLYYTTDATNLLITPAMNFGSATSAVLTFWHTQEFWAPDQDQLAIQYRTNTSAAWVTITNYTANISAWTQRTLSLPTLSTNYQIAFRGWATYGYGVCLDDIQVVSSTPGSGGGIGSPPAPQSITVSNSGYGFLQVSNVWTVPWLNVQPLTASGLAAGQSAQFTVSILTNTVRLGTNTAILTLTSTNAANAPVQVPVTLSVNTNLTAWQLTVLSANPQWGSADPLSGLYLSGQPVRLSATPSNYYYFVQWTGGVQGVSAVTNIVLNAGITTTAVFAEIILTNGTPAWWLGQHNLPANDSGALSDSDFDGLAAWQEYLAGTVPTNAGSVFNMTGLSVSGPTVVRWSTVSGRVYSVYWTSNLLNGFATVLGTNIPWSQPVFTDAVYGAQNQGFYQIKVKLLP